MIDTAATIADRRQRWQRLPADQRIRRVHTAVADAIAYARWRRQPGRRHPNNDFLFLKELQNDHAIPQ